MKFSKLWLDDFIDHQLDTAKLCEQLTMAGLEIDQVKAVANDFSGVVVGEIIEVNKHPDADKLSVCKVNAGQDDLLTIVCGASNVRPGLRVPVAMIGAELANNFKIKQAKLRGIESFGMMCSAVELGLAESSSGLLELPQDAPIGVDVRKYLMLNDEVATIELTSNRGDCLSMLGVAREVAAINRLKLKELPVPTINVQGPGLEVIISAKDACPRYTGRIIRNINNNVTTPIWIKERLRRLGISIINPVVDVTNYVMLELGQPLHAFDVAKIDKAINVRYAAENEELILLNGNKIKLSSDDLVIADNTKILALAGIMGGIDSGVSLNTTDIFLESAFFMPEKIINHARNYGLQTDASYRYERGVDHQLQLKALDHATALLLDIVGGQASEVSRAYDEQNLPKDKLIHLHKNNIHKTLGISLCDNVVVDILECLGMQVTLTDSIWHVVPPSWRFDINIEADLIEELARIHGYNNIHEQPILAQLIPPNTHDTNARKNRIYELMLSLGYHEVITYSFTDPKLQKILDPDKQALELVNPISPQLAVMRTSVWPGLINAAKYNLNRQKSRVRFFEIGLRFLQAESHKPVTASSASNTAIQETHLDCFERNACNDDTCLHDDEISQIPTLSGLIMGDLYPKQWGVDKNLVDFFAVKNDVSAILKLFGSGKNVEYRASNHSALHPKRQAAIYLDGNFVGTMGEIHPKAKQELDLAQTAYLFELCLFAALQENKKNFSNFSKFPAIQRDIAIVVNKAISFQQIKQKIIDNSQELLHNIELFDIYCGEGIGLENRSLAIRLVFQSQDCTLVDAQIETVLNKIVDSLQQSFGANLRG